MKWGQKKADNQHPTMCAFLISHTPNSENDIMIIIILNSKKPSPNNLWKMIKYDTGSICCWISMADLRYLIWLKAKYKEVKI